MNMTNKEYRDFARRHAPKSRLFPNMLRAYLIGGLICTIGAAFIYLYQALGVSEENSSTLTTMTMVLLGALLTGLGIYDDLAKIGGAGTLVPITGFANAVVSPALEFKSEGIVTGMAAKMFVISGPVIVFGISASVIYGLIYAMII